MTPAADWELERPSAAQGEIPRRVVSLVPSLTESLFDLGFGAEVVGITDYCIYPAGQIEGLPRLGGPKSIRIDELIALKPDLVVANREENDADQVRRLQAEGLRVLLTFPTSVVETIKMLWDLVYIFHSDIAAQKVTLLEITLDWMRSAMLDVPTVRYFCPIWQDSGRETGTPWWMTFNANTYSTDLLRLVGGENVFDGRKRRYPLAADLGLAAAENPGLRDERYPRVSGEEILQADPQVVLFPSEPFPYQAEHLLEFANTFPSLSATKQNRLVPVDGTLVTWCGTRLAVALQGLPNLFVSQS